MQASRVALFTTRPSSQSTPHYASHSDPSLPPQPYCRHSEGEGTHPRDLWHVDALEARKLVNCASYRLPGSLDRSGHGWEGVGDPEAAPEVHGSACGSDVRAWWKKVGE